MVIHLFVNGDWECGRKWSSSSDFIIIQDRNQFDHLIEFVIRVDKICKRCYNNYISKIPDRRELDEYGWNYRSEKEYYEVFDKNISLEKENHNKDMIISFMKGRLELSESDYEKILTEIKF